MFVVHTVNQLEEAVRVGAEEILVTGCLADNVQEAYHSKAYKDKTWEEMSLTAITGEYELLDPHLDSRSPYTILQRTTEH